MILRDLGSHGDESISDLVEEDTELGCHEYLGGDAHKFVGFKKLQELVKDLVLVGL